MIVKPFVMKGIAKEPNMLGDCQRGLFIPIGDLQFGTAEFPVKKFTSFLDWALDRNAYFLGMGDFFDFSSFTDRKTMAPLRDSTREVLDSMITERVEELVGILSRSYGRWVGFLEGNHQWTFRNGRSVEQLIAKRLGGDFLGTMAMVRLIAEDRPEGATDADTVVCVHHGYGGARTAGPRLINVERLVEGFEADLYLMGHDHSDVHESIDRMHLTPGGNNMYGRRKVFARTGGWMRSYVAKGPQPVDAPASDSRGGYAEERAFTPKAMGSPFFTIGYEKVADKVYKPRIGFGRF